jgi:hypothetical protein
VTAEDVLRDAAPDLYEALAALVAMHDRDTALVGRLSRQYCEECWARARRALREARAGVPDRKETK